MVKVNAAATSGFALQKAMLTTQAMRMEQLANDESATKIRREAERFAILGDQRASAEEFFQMTQAYLKAAQEAHLNAK